MSMLQRVLRSASRCADIVRIAGAQALNDEILEEGYAHTWLAYQHAATQVRRLTTRGQYQASDRWLDRRDSYATTRRAIWEEMVRRGLRSEAPLVGPRLTDHAS